MTAKLLSAALLALSSAAVFADEPVVQTASATEVTPATASVRSCAQETGSRVPGSRADCLSGSHVKTYDRGYLLSGSSMDSPVAVLRSDPAIMIRYK